MTSAGQNASGPTLTENIFIRKWHCDWEVQAAAGTANRRGEQRQVLFLVRNVAWTNWITVDGTRNAPSGARENERERERENQKF